MRFCLVFVIALAWLPLAVVAADGLTPEGRYWAVSPDETELGVWSLGGDQHQLCRLQSGEGRVLSVSDDGSRVTWKLEDWGPEPPDPRLGVDEWSGLATFRSCDGTVLGQHSIDFWEITINPAAHGSAVYFIRRLDSDYALMQMNAAGDTKAVAQIPVRRVLETAGAPWKVDIYATAAGTVVSIYGLSSTVYIVAGRDSLLVPRGPKSCFNRIHDLVFPRPNGCLARVTKYMVMPANFPLWHEIQVVTFDAQGQQVADVELEKGRDFFALPQGGLLVTKEMAATVYDSRDQPTKTIPTWCQGEAACRGVELVRRIRALGDEATGRDWAELQLLPKEDSEHVDRLGAGIGARDPVGAIDRFSEIPDGSPLIQAARSGFRSAMRGARDHFPDPWLQAIEHATAIVEAGAANWFRLSAAFPILIEKGKDSPAWVLPAVLESIAAIAEGADTMMIPEELLTADVASRLMAIECTRLKELDQEKRGAILAVLQGRAQGPASFIEAVFEGFPEEEILKVSRQLLFQLPPGFMTDEILQCVEGGGLGMITAAMNTLGAPYRMKMGCQQNQDCDSHQDPAPEVSEDLKARIEAVAATLTRARSSDDSSVRACVQLMSLAYELPVDPVSWRRDVLSQPDLVGTALGMLKLDDLSADELWLELLVAALGAARSGCADPEKCLPEGGRELVGVGELTAEYRAELVNYFGHRFTDPYCRFVAQVPSLVSFASDNLRGEAIARWALSDEAPPEVRVSARLGRVFAGIEDLEQTISIWRNPLVPWGLRTELLRPEFLSSLEYANEFIEAVLEDARSGRLSARELGDLAALLVSSRPEVVADLTLWLVSHGKLGVDDPVESLIWILRGLDPTILAQNQGARDELRSWLGADPVGHHAALALARAGDATALAALELAIISGHVERSARGQWTMDIEGAEGYLDLFSPLGNEGMETLRAICQKISDDAVTEPLEALFKMQPEAALGIAARRLVRLLGKGCVPGNTFFFLERHGTPALAVVLRELADRGCDPDSLVFIGDWPSEEAIEKAVAVGADSPCKVDLSELFGKRLF